MKETKNITDSEKDKVLEKLSKRYNFVSIGTIEKYSPYRYYFVTLYFEDKNFTISNRFNVSIDDNLYNFTISNIAKVSNETNVTIRITKQ